MTAMTLYLLGLVALSVFLDEVAGNRLFVRAAWLCWPLTVVVSLAGAVVVWCRDQWRTIRAPGALL